MMASLGDENMLDIRSYQVCKYSAALSEVKQTCFHFKPKLVAFGKIYNFSKVVEVDKYLPF